MYWVDCSLNISLQFCLEKESEFSMKVVNRGLAEEPSASTVAKAPQHLGTFTAAAQLLGIILSINVQGRSFIFYWISIES